MTDNSCHILHIGDHPPAGWQVKHLAGGGQVAYDPRAVPASRIRGAIHDGTPHPFNSDTTDLTAVVSNHGVVVLETA